MVLDDLMEEGDNDKRVLDLLTKGSHHRNIITVLYLCQDILRQQHLAKCMVKVAEAPGQGPPNKSVKMKSPTEIKKEEPSKESPKKTFPRHLKEPSLIEEMKATGFKPKTLLRQKQNV